jgi:WD40 repeat protein
MTICSKRLIVWDSDRCEQIKGLSSTIVLDASFASFDPSNFEQFIIGGRDGIQIWKTYKGRNTHYLRSTKLPIPRDIETKKQQFTCHCWGNNGHFYAANRYGELLFIDAITVRVIQVIDTASRASGTSISALLCTSDFLLITYFDGEVYWLSMKDYEIVQTVSLPEGSMGKESNQIVSMTPSPSYSKAYIGTRGGVIYELKTHVDLDDEDEDDEEKAISSLLSTWGSFHAGPAFACCTLTPFGGMYGSDSLIVSSGLNGMICFWSISKGRLLSHCNIPSLFGSTANESAIGMSFSASAITAVVARATDPVLAVGDQSGKLRFLCVSKGVGNGLIEFLPLHSIQILEAPVDTMHVHPSQPYLLVSSTFDKLVFIVSMDHEKRFEVVSISTISDESDRIVDVKWSFSENSTTHLKFICFTTNGSIESGVYSCDGGFAPIKLKLERVSYGVELTKRCNHFLPIQGVPPNILLATSHTTRDVALFKYTQGSEGEAGTVLWKTLVQDAHEQGVSCIARFECLLRGDEELFVTGDLNGVITLWMITYGGSSVCNFRDLEDVQVVKKNSISLHDGPVTSVNIFDMQEALYVISTGKEGNVFVLEVRIPQEIETMRPPLSLEMNTMYTNLVSFAKYDNMQPGTESNKPILQIWKDEQEAADRSKFDVAKEKIRSPLNKLEAKLKLLLSENEKLQPNEQLQREDFVINTDWRNHLMSLNKDRAQRVRDNIMKELAKMSIVRERMKGEFWESTAVKGLKLYSLQSGSFVFNFPMRKLDKKESSLKTKLDLLRLVEFQHQAQEVNDCGAIKETSYLSRFKEIVPPNLQWMIDAGLHHPAFNRWFEKSRSSNTPLDFSSGHPFLPSVFNDIKSFMLVYHPVTIRTRKQQRTQIQLLHAYERYLLTEYNNEFAEMVKLKQSKIEEIDAKN